MSALALPQPLPAPTLGCTICRDLGAFEDLVPEMRAALGPGWTGFDFAAARAFIASEESEALTLAVLAIEREDELAFAELLDIVRTAAARGVRVVIVARDVGAAALHHLLGAGAAAFVPYPVPGSALREAIRLAETPPAPPPAAPPRPAREGTLLAVQGLAGGAGATTFAVTLATELARQGKAPPRVCLLDLDLQFGTVATALDLPRRDAVFELLSDAATLDADTLEQALLPQGDGLHVLTAPAEMLPLDFVTPDDIARLLAAARGRFDYVVVDLPAAVVQWTETVLHAAELCFAVLELDMRSAQNAQRLIRALKAEELPLEKLRYVLNRAPGGTDFAGRGRVRRLEEALGIKVELRLPDGGRKVREAADHGSPLAAFAPRNPLRRAVGRLAGDLVARARAAA